MSPPLPDPELALAFRAEKVGPILAHSFACGGHETEEGWQAFEGAIGDTLEGGVMRVMFLFGTPGVTAGKRAQVQRATERGMKVILTFNGSVTAQGSGDPNQTPPDYPNPGKDWIQQEVVPELTYCRDTLGADILGVELWEESDLPDHWIAPDPRVDSFSDFIAEALPELYAQFPDPPWWVTFGMASGRAYDWLRAVLQRLVLDGTDALLTCLVFHKYQSVPSASRFQFQRFREIYTEETGRVLPHVFCTEGNIGLRTSRLTTGDGSAWWLHMLASCIAGGADGFTLFFLTDQSGELSVNGYGTGMVWLPIDPLNPAPGFYTAKPIAADTGRLLAKIRNLAAATAEFSGNDAVAAIGGRSGHTLHLVLSCFPGNGGADRDLHGKDLLDGAGVDVQALGPFEQDVRDFFDHVLEFNAIDGGAYATTHASEEADWLDIRDQLDALAQYRSQGWAPFNVLAPTEGCCGFRQVEVLEGGIVITEVTEERIVGTIPTNSVGELTAMVGDC